MNDLSDQQLLRDYSEHKSESAFAELVRRYVDMVHSAAFRMVRDAHLAQDVTQAAFVQLAQHARELTDRVTIAGWLHNTARNLAAKSVRTDIRRRSRELEAALMNELNSAPPDPSWEQISLHLDDALGELTEPERDALLLRYFKNHDLRTVGATLGISDDAAQKRVSRAVERLREIFAKRGVRVGASGLVVVITSNAVQAAPVGLAVTISTAAALTGTTLATTGTITGTITATKAIVMTALQKTIVTATVAILAALGIYETRQASKMREKVQALQQQQAPMTERLRQLQTEHDEAAHQLAALREDNARLNRNSGELLKLRDQVTRLNADSQELALLKAAGLEEANNPTELAMKNWVARARDLTKRIEQIPDAQIPEFQFLTPTDWLDIAKDASLETDADLRNAAQMLGANAKNRFAGLMKAVLNKFLEANNGELPTTMDQLKPFFPASIDDSLLQRYELLQSGNIKNIPEADRSFRLVGERRMAPAGSARPIIQIGTAGFIRTGQ